MPKPEPSSQFRARLARLAYLRRTLEDLISRSDL